MYIRILFFLGLFLSIIACDDKKEESIESTPLETQAPKETEVPQPQVYEAQENWKSYYTHLVEDFNLNNFQKQESFDLVPQKSTITPIWDSSFNPVYKNFIRYNADSTKYVDFMSYKLKFDENNELLLEADQEVVVVDIPHKKVERILFYGPSYWIEDAYFKNDSTLILLENSTDKIPAYQEINLHTYKSTYYTYPKELKENSTYLKDKILSLYQDNL